MTSLVHNANIRLRAVETADHQIPANTIVRSRKSLFLNYKALLNQQKTLLTLESSRGQVLELCAQAVTAIANDLADSYDKVERENRKTDPAHIDTDDVTQQQRLQRFDIVGLLKTEHEGSLVFNTIEQDARGDLTTELGSNRKGGAGDNFYLKAIEFIARGKKLKSKLTLQQCKAVLQRRGELQQTALRFLLDGFDLPTSSKQDSKKFVLNKRLSERLKEVMKVKASINDSKAVPSKQLKATDYSKPNSCVRLEMLREAIVEVLKPNPREVIATQIALLVTTRKTEQTAPQFLSHLAARNKAFETKKVCKLAPDILKYLWYSHCGADEKNKLDKLGFNIDAPWKENTWLSTYEAMQNESNSHFWNVHKPTPEERQRFAQELAMPTKKGSKDPNKKTSLNDQNSKSTPTTGKRKMGNDAKPKTESGDKPKETSSKKQIVIACDYCRGFQNTMKKAESKMRYEELYSSERVKARTGKHKTSACQFGPVGYEFTKRSNASLAEWKDLTANEKKSQLDIAAEKRKAMGKKRGRFSKKGKSGQ